GVAGGAAGRARQRAGAGAAARAVGPRADAGAGDRRARAVAGRAWARHAPARAGPARRAARLPRPPGRARRPVPAAGREPGMSGVLSRAPAPRRGVRSRRACGPAFEALLLWLGAALLAGFTIRDQLEPFDEGLLLQAGLRI